MSDYRKEINEFVNRCVREKARIIEEALAELIANGASLDDLCVVERMSGGIALDSTEIHFKGRPVASIETVFAGREYKIRKVPR